MLTSRTCVKVVVGAQWSTSSTVLACDGSTLQFMGGSDGHPTRIRTVQPRKETRMQGQGSDRKGYVEVVAGK